MEPKSSFSDFQPAPSRGEPIALYVKRIGALKRNAGIPLRASESDTGVPYTENTELRWEREVPVEVPEGLTPKQYLDIINASPGNE